MPADFRWESNFTDRCEVYTQLHLDRSYLVPSNQTTYYSAQSHSVRYDLGNLNSALLTILTSKIAVEAQQMSRLGSIATLQLHVYFLTITSRYLPIGILKKTSHTDDMYTYQCDYDSEIL